MKITKVTPYPFFAGPKNLMLCRVDTDEGVYGWGEAYVVQGKEKAVQLYIEAMEAYMIGRSPFEIKHSRHSHVRRLLHPPQQLRLLRRLERHRDRHVGHRRKGLRPAGVQPARRPRAARRSACTPTAGGAAPRASTRRWNGALAVKGKGFTAMKWDPFQGYWRNYITPAQEDYAVECVKAVREAVGPDVDLLVEVHRRLSPYHAIHFSERIQEFNPFWIEEPCLAGQHRPDRLAHAGIKAPVVTGETLYNKEAFIPVFEKHAAEIINPDICVSGIKVMSEISAMAEPYSVLMSPHNFNSNAVGLAAMIHLSASIPNFLIGEMFLTVDEASREIMVEPFEIKNGYVALPTKPGLGIDIDMDKLSQRPYKFFERKFPFKGRLRLPR